MPRVARRLLIPCLMLALLSVPILVVQAAPLTYSNTATVTIPASGSMGISDPYPSDIVVADLEGEIESITVEIHSLTHTGPYQLDILLVGPGGETTILMGAAGGSEDLAGVDLTFDDAAATGLPFGTQIASGTYRPTTYQSRELTSPAPAGPYGTTLAVFSGTDPNGTWSLYVEDVSPDDIGALAGGWSLNITLASGVAAQTCLFAGSLSRVSTISEGDEESDFSCVRGSEVFLLEGSDVYGCLFAGSLSQVGTSEPKDCGRGAVIGLAAGDGLYACLYAGRLSQVGFNQPSSCGRGVEIQLAAGAN